MPGTRLVDDFENDEQAAASRSGFLRRRRYPGAHHPHPFPRPTVGRIEADGDRFRPLPVRLLVRRIPPRPIFNRTPKPRRGRRGSPITARRTSWSTASISPSTSTGRPTNVTSRSALRAQPGRLPDLPPCTWTGTALVLVSVSAGTVGRFSASAQYHLARRQALRHPRPAIRPATLEIETRIDPAANFGLTPRPRTSPRAATSPNARPRA